MNENLIRASLYGESLFVTLLVTPDNEILFFDEQWNKLVAELCSLSTNWDKEKEKLLISEQIHKQLITIGKSRSSYKRLRITYRFNAPGLPLLISNKDQLQSHWVGTILISPIDFTLDAVNIKKLKPFIKQFDERLQFSCKVGSFGYESLYFLKNPSEQWNDFLWINSDQSVRECSTANVFAINEKEWVTPCLKNCYAGVTREALIQWLPTQGIKVEIRDLSLDDLKKSKCIIFSNAIQIMGLAELIDSKCVDNSYQNFILELRRKFFLDMKDKTGRKLTL